MNEKLTITKSGMLRYSYKLDAQGDCGFEFNSLCEVGAPYQRWFADEIQHRKLTVEFDRELPEAPYSADFVVEGK